MGYLGLQGTTVIHSFTQQPFPQPPTLWTRPRATHWGQGRAGIHGSCLLYNALWHVQDSGCHGTHGHMAWARNSGLEGLTLTLRTSF